MEDLATDRIYRLMIAQRIKHRDAVKITTDDGSEVQHTPELITKLFDEELEKILQRFASRRLGETRERYVTPKREKSARR